MRYYMVICGIGGSVGGFCVHCAWMETTEYILFASYIRSKGCAVSSNYVGLKVNGVFVAWCRNTKKEKNAACDTCCNKGCLQGT